MQFIENDQFAIRLKLLNCRLIAGELQPVTRTRFDGGILLRKSLLAGQQNEYAIRADGFSNCICKSIKQISYGRDRTQDFGRFAHRRPEVQMVSADKETVSQAL